MNTPLLDVRDLVVRHGTVTAVDHVSFTLAPGETLALDGPSGCGKSSTAHAVLQLRRPDSGEVRFEGRELTALSERGLRPLRSRMQPVFQDPYGSLSPRHRIRDAVAEPLRLQGRRPTAAEVAERTLRRPVPTRGHSPGVGVPATTAGPRRAGVGAGPLRPGRHPQPARRPPGRTGPRVPVHLPRPGGRTAFRGPGAGDARGADHARVAASMTWRRPSVRVSASGALFGSKDHWPIRPVISAR